MAKKNGKSKLRKPYAERSDLEKIQSQWVKLTGLHDRTDYSAAVIRAASATELAVNYALRNEFSAQSQLNSKFIDSLFIWANGLNGKVDRLLLPILAGSPKHATVKGLWPLAKKINKKRNEIAHSGHFCTNKEARDLITNCQTVVHGIVHLYDLDFLLKEKSSPDG